MEEAAERRRPVSSERSPQVVALERERESLQLSRTRVLQDLAATNNPRYRELLDRSLKFLDEKLAAMDRASKLNRPE